MRLPKEPWDSITDADLTEGGSIRVLTDSKPGHRRTFYVSATQNGNLMIQGTGNGTTLIQPIDGQTVIVSIDRQNQ